MEGLSCRIWERESVVIAWETSERRWSVARFCVNVF